METKTERLYPSLPKENRKIDLEQRLEKNLHNVNSFNNLIKDTKEMITYFKVKNQKLRTRHKKYKTLTSILASVDRVVIIGSTTTSVTLSVSGIGSIVVPISAGIACGCH